MTPGESPHVLCGWVAWGIHVARASLPWWGGGSRETQTEEGDQNNPLEKAMTSPFLGRRVETFLLTVFSWNFHAYPNLMCLGLLTAGHSCRQKE